MKEDAHSNTKVGVDWARPFAVAEEIREAITRKITKNECHIIYQLEGYFKIHVDKR